MAFGFDISPNNISLMFANCGNQVHPATVARWATHYAGLVERYATTLRPSAGYRWSADEKYKRVSLAVFSHRHGHPIRTVMGDIHWQDELRRRWTAGQGSSGHSGPSRTMSFPQSVQKDLLVRPGSASGARGRLSLDEKILQQQRPREIQRRTR